MLKWIGIILVIGGAAAVGIRAVGQLSTRVRLIRQLIGDLGYMRSEISFNLTPMPELVERLEERSAREGKSFYQTLRTGLARLGDDSFADIWKAAVTSALGPHLKNEELTVLISIGGVLGRYDSEEQVRSIEYACERLQTYLKSAETERSEQGKVYGAVSVLSGIAAIVILI